MRIVFHFAVVLATAIAVLSCAQDAPIPVEKSPKEEVFGEWVPEQDLLHEMNVKVSETLSADLEKATDDEGYVDLSAFEDFSGAGVVKMKRLFPYAGDFEKRTREKGLHLWYVLYYDESHTMTKTAEKLDLPGVNLIEYSPKTKIVGEVEEVQFNDLATRADSPSFPFDDPMLKDQWHYYNNGTASSSVSGCDINVVPVWSNYSTYAKYTGDIVVGIVDGGIDYAHEDLNANMWKNPESSGDAVYGKNFTDGSYNIHAEKHGTHVAGTIGAVNNNGKGVCGVAGGDSQRGVKGAKLMSLQIFDGEKQGSGAEAIKWSADHGAVISQNSWGYVFEPSDYDAGRVTTPESLKNAVDYFIENAGIDSKGTQVGPMRGGLVIFAAGNESRSMSGNDYEKILNVGSVGADFRRAYYSNYGDWIDVSAPGGDAQKGNQVLSTIPDNKYGRLQGTSMACPHVSGLAALILARFGGEGYTAAALRKQIEDNLTDISSFNAMFPIGKGLINAYRSVAGSGGAAPDLPTDLAVTSNSNNLNFSIKVPQDSDDGRPNTIYLCYSKEDFTSMSGNEFGVFYVGNAQVGETLTGTISGLEFSTEYYVAALACDLGGNKSPLTDRIKVSTGKNNAPIINDLSPKDLTVKPFETKSVEMEIVEPDGHFYSIEMSPKTDWTVLDTLTRNKPVIRIDGIKAKEGAQFADLVVTDIYGLSTTKRVTYTVLENHVPEVGSTISDIFFSSKSVASQEFAAEDCFKDADGEPLSYSFEIANPTIANVSLSKGKFLITPINYGTTEVTITATDARKESVSQKFNVLVLDSTKPVELYPNPVQTTLNVRVMSEGEASIKIVSATGAVFFEGSLGKVSPLTPATVNMTDALPGQYTAVVTVDGKEFKSYIVKI